MTCAVEPPPPIGLVVVNTFGFIHETFGLVRGLREVSRRRLWVCVSASRGGTHLDLTVAPALGAVVFLSKLAMQVVAQRSEARGRRAVPVEREEATGLARGARGNVLA